MLDGAVQLTNENGKPLDGAKPEVVADGVNPKSIADGVRHGAGLIGSWIMSRLAWSNRR